MDDSVLRFYEQLAGEYHLIFEDWNESVRWQGTALDEFIHRQTGKGAMSVLDCSCGIGTQAIGLALHGHTVHATDLSPSAVARAKQEAEGFGVSITFGVADFRRLERQVKGSFDVVLSCDNSLPHLLSDEDLLRAARSMRSKLRADGLLLISIRDYDEIVKKKPRLASPRILDAPEGRRIVFQVWDWHDGRTYTMHHFIVQQTDGGWQTVERMTDYRALLREELSDILREAGFSGIRWHTTDESGYVQPIVTATGGSAPLAYNVDH